MVDKYQSYPEYEATGVDWIGALPHEWKLKKLKFVADIQTGTTPPTSKESCFSDIDGIPWVKPDELSEFVPIFSAKKFLTEEGATLSRLIRKGSVLVCGIGTIGKFGVAGVDIFTNQQINSVSFNQLMIDDYGKYLIASAEVELVRLANGNVVKILNTESQKNIDIPCPPLAEQKGVANFLDHETAKIDTLIAKQQQLIKLLKEKRQAVISHAVTKGLNPDAPMKDSGVEWLGEVPEHWDIKRLKHISPKIGVGLVINPSTYTRNEGVYFIFGGDVKEYGFDLSKTRRISPEDSDSLLPSRLNHRDLVCIRVGYPGVTAVVPRELEGSNCASVIVIRCGDYNSDWLCAAMNMWVGRQQVELASYGAAQKQFNVADAIEFIFPVPPQQEQDKIANFVYQSLNKFNTLSEKTQKQIKLLQERRTCLISAAVTGKIDIRNWKVEWGLYEKQYTP